MSFTPDVAQLPERGTKVELREGVCLTGQYGVWKGPHEFIIQERQGDGIELQCRETGYFVFLTRHSFHSIFFVKETI